MNGPPASASGQGALPLESWDQPPRRRLGPAAAPVLAVDGFEGPLDWLLDLARTRRIDLARLSIVALVEAFADALTAALAAPDLRPTLLGRWGDWLVMAADLTLLCSRLLVPADAAAAQDAHDEAERLRQRLLGRAEISRVADWLEGRGQLGRDVFGRGQADGQGSYGRGGSGTSPPCCGRVSPRSACRPRLVRSTACPGRRSGVWPTRPSGSGPCWRRSARPAQSWRPSCRRCQRMRRSGTCGAGWRWRGPFWRGWS